MTKIAIIDYGLGNLRSVIRGLERPGRRQLLPPMPMRSHLLTDLSYRGSGHFMRAWINWAPLKKRF